MRWDDVTWLVTNCQAAFLVLEQRNRFRKFGLNETEMGRKDLVTRLLDETTVRQGSQSMVVELMVNHERSRTRTSAIS